MPFTSYLSINNLHEPFQSAYKQFHSCETSLLRVNNDVLQAIDNRKCVALLLLDLSAAFDTVDHEILLNRLNSKFGISGNALMLFRTYLSNRRQFVRLDDSSSTPLELDCGVLNDLFLDLSCTYSTLLLLLIFYIAMICQFTCMQMIHNYTSRFSVMMMKICTSP